MRETDNNTPEDLLRRYFDAQLDEDGERQLRQMLAEADPAALGPEAAAAAAMFRGFNSLSRVRMPKRRRSLIPRLMIAGTSAAAAAAAILIALHALSPVYGYDCEGRPIRDAADAMEQSGYLTLLEDLEESFRCTEAIFRTGDTDSGQQ